MPDQKLTWLTRRPTPWSALVPLVALGAGILFATSAATAKGTDLRSSTSDLPGLIREHTRTNALAAQQVGTLRTQVDQLSAKQAPGDLRVTQLTRQADKLQLEAGTEAVTGPTVKVTLTDAKNVPDPLPDGFTVDDYVVHQQDVQAVVNALWQGGAEAMMLMDQRVISTSAVRCVGNTLILQGRVYSPPYVITAMGDPMALRAALNTSPAVQIYRQYVDAVGLGYDLQTRPQQTFPAYAGSINLQFARTGS
ncbi:DUF881 domain-containing protein [Phycicoccus sp. M110.8]|uniref:DUF881 domain-containing protein n=1 Tax=Phycicoccus sp. M110.8 TaxID=3075433 RepID=UPI0028FD672C|nr:DUF881 domain-containing protein [Phycicoccus sp. M110.8]MDU0313727.1 DUF881 domain-containing protein [Phycicoccus sp. M110.8]HET8768594.1 DUF881 domain-containing protein [Pedococcus sp.]